MGSAQNNLKSYLSNRKQYLYVNNTESDYLNIVSGAPQRSILGPLFFNVCMNDFTICFLTGKVTLYTDDTVIFYAIKIDIIKITKWSANKKLLECENK